MIHAFDLMRVKSVLVNWFCVVVQEFVEPYGHIFAP